MPVPATTACCSGSGSPCPTTGPCPRVTRSCGSTSRPATSAAASSRKRSSAPPRLLQEQDPAIVVDRPGCKTLKEALPEKWDSRPRRQACFHVRQHLAADLQGADDEDLRRECRAICLLVSLSAGKITVRNLPGFLEALEKAVGDGHVTGAAVDDESRVDLPADGGRNHQHAVLATQGDFERAARGL